MDDAGCGDDVRPAVGLADEFLAAHGFEPVMTAAQADAVGAGRRAAFSEPFRWSVRQSSVGRSMTTREPRSRSGGDQPRHPVRLGDHDHVSSTASDGVIIGRPDHP